MLFFKVNPFASLGFLFLETEYGLNVKLQFGRVAAIVMIVQIAL